MILDAGERVYHIIHFPRGFWSKRKRNQLDELKSFPFNGHHYMFNQDRAFRIRWAPWKKQRTWNPIRLLFELLRSKKIGLLLYQEPCSHRCSICKHKDESICPVPDRIEPMHISRIHQPSGEMMG